MRSQEEAEEKMRLVRTLVLDHLEVYPEVHPSRTHTRNRTRTLPPQPSSHPPHNASQTQSLLVIEEYDKADCATRAMLRQLLNRGAASDAASPHARRSVVVLEANTGFNHLVALLSAAGGRRRLPFEAAHNALKDVVAEQWARDACESGEDRAKLLSLIDAFVPFLPLERGHVRELLGRELRRRAAGYERAGEVGSLEWDKGVPDFLLEKARRNPRGKRLLCLRPAPLASSAH